GPRAAAGSAAAGRTAAPVGRAALDRPPPRPAAAAAGPARAARGAGVSQQRLAAVRVPQADTGVLAGGLPGGSSGRGAGPPADAPPLARIHPAPAQIAASARLRPGTARHTPVRPPATRTRPTMAVSEPSGKPEESAQSPASLPPGWRPS